MLCSSGRATPAAGRASPRAACAGTWKRRAEAGLAGVL
jgi:hypothetical protein